MMRHGRIRARPIVVALAVTVVIVVGYAFFRVRPKASVAEDRADVEVPRRADAGRHEGERNLPIRSHDREVRQVGLNRRRLQDLDRRVTDAHVTADDVSSFLRMFSDLPPHEKKECLLRVLNLVPDSNIALLKGLLFDRRQPTYVVRAVFNDIVNRPEEIKKPILDEIYKDKTHPCCSDAEWIFEVTGEKPTE